MLSCRRASQLASERLDRDLSLWERFLLRGHLLICSNCRRMARQLRRLQSLVRSIDPVTPPAIDDAEVAGLPQPARDRIQAAIDARRHGNG